MAETARAAGASIVVFGSFVGIGEDFVGGLDGLELCCDFAFSSWVAIGVVC
jgi:hypothetical protein